MSFVELELFSVSLPFDILHLNFELDLNLLTLLNSTPLNRAPFMDC